jgi:hypothetical protein
MSRTGIKRIAGNSVLAACRALLVAVSFSNPNAVAQVDADPRSDSHHHRLLATQTVLIEWGRRLQQVDTNLYQAVRQHRIEVRAHNAVADEHQRLVDAHNTHCPPTSENRDLIETCNVRAQFLNKRADEIEERAQRLNQAGSALERRRNLLAQEVSAWTEQERQNRAALQSSRRSGDEDVESSFP